ncbi:hypothetical protein [Amycolatopsis anabasis]|nr:hypothetical protein [Amycolatopsis anabasis]
MDETAFDPIGPTVAIDWRIIIRVTGRAYRQRRLAGPQQRASPNQ